VSHLLPDSITSVTW